MFPISTLQSLLLAIALFSALGNTLPTAETPTATSDMEYNKFTTILTRPVGYPTFTLKPTPIPLTPLPVGGSVQIPDPSPLYDAPSRVLRRNLTDPGDEPPTLTRSFSIKPSHLII